MLFTEIDNFFLKKESLSRKNESCQLVEKAKHKEKNKLLWLNFRPRYNHHIRVQNAIYAWLLHLQGQEEFL